MGQTTSFDRNTVKTNVLVLGENTTNREARYIHGTKGKGMFTFYGGHDPEDYHASSRRPKNRIGFASNIARIPFNFEQCALFPAAKKEESNKT